ncbi:uncharacterized protein G2W53_009833 [Senna tora]|uniref:Uncharacterized protein n=1 Tax=Senna tora TaxID=362788 RepID=A0A835C8U5_9FABA|nr:uncharacterized protein G2W53_009833 [Senna tora]
MYSRRSGFDAPIGVVLAWEERGSCPTYSGRQIAVGSQKPSRITRKKTCCASESNTSGRVVFAYRSGFDATIGVVLAWEERGSCLNIFRATNRGRISETFTNYEAKDTLRKKRHELRGKRHVAQVSQTRRFALYLRTEVVLMLRLESSWRGRSVDHVFTYFGRQIAVGSQKPSRITRQKTCCACESNTWVRVEFANGSCYDSPIGVVLAWEEHGSCLNIFRTTNHGRISRTSRITRQKTFCATESNTSVRVVFANGIGFDAPIGVVLAWEERGSCPTYSGRKIAVDLRNLHELRGKRLVTRVIQTRRFALYSRAGVVLMLRLESSQHGRSVNHVLTYSGRQIAVGSQKP